MRNIFTSLALIGLIGVCQAYIPSYARGLQARQTELFCNKWFTTLDGDNCLIVAVLSDITVDDLIEWNPSLQSGICDELILPNTDYCVGVSETAPQTTTKTTTKLTSITTIGTTTKPTTTTTKPVTTGNGITTPAPIQTGMTTSCNKFHYVTSGQTCQDIVSAYPGTSVALLFQWNPAIGSTCNGMWADTYLCVAVIGGTPTTKTTTAITTASDGTPSPIGSGTTKNCQKWAYIRVGDTCLTILSRNTGVSSTLADLFRWNPSIKSDCSAMIAHNYLCIVGPTAATTTTKVVTTAANGTPSPIGSGTTQNCKKWAYIRVGDTCLTILSRNTDVSSTVADLFRWNPSIKSDCSAMIAHNYLCILGPSPTTTKPVTTTANPTPSPIQSGQTKNCKGWAYVKEGQTCQDIINAKPTLKLTLAQLYAWNPAIGKDCSTMWAKTFLCVEIK